MEAHIQHAAAVAPVIKGMVKAELAEVLSDAKAPLTTPLDIQTRPESLHAAAEILSKRPQLGKEWLKEIEDIQNEWE